MSLSPGLSVWGTNCNLLLSRSTTGVDVPISPTCMLPLERRLYLVFIHHQQLTLCNNSSNEMGYSHAAPPSLVNLQLYQTNIQTLVVLQMVGTG